MSAYFSVPEAADHLGVATKTIRRAIQEGRLPAYRLGNRIIKIRTTDLDSFPTPIRPGEPLDEDDTDC